MKFIKQSKYVSSLVSNDRDDMSRFVKGVLEEIEEEWRAAMLYENIDLSRLMVHSQQDEHIRLRRKNW